MKRIALIIISMLMAARVCGADQPISIKHLMSQKLALASDDMQTDDDNMNFPLSSEKYKEQYKSSSRAAFYSLIVPGAGQYYIDKGYKSKVFFGIETGLWLTYFGFRKYGDFKDDAARGWAVLHAGANADNGDDNYWVKMTYYDNRDRNENDGQGYNQMAAVYDRGEANLFPETPQYYWNWDTRDARQKYRNLRNQSKTALERADIAVGVIIANHVVSALEAFFSASKFNRHLEFSAAGFELKYKIKANLKNPAVSVTLVRNF